MSENEIKTIIAKYKRKAKLSLLIFFIVAIAVNWFVIGQAIDKNAALGIPYNYPETGLLWVVLIGGLSLVFNHCIDLVEKVLIDIYSLKNQLNSLTHFFNDSF